MVHVVARWSESGHILFRRQPSCTLVHVHGSSARASQLILVDRSGELIQPVGQSQEQWPFPALSPDGTWIGDDSRSGIVVVENWLEEFKPHP